MYEEVSRSAAPRGALLDFMESAYMAGEKTAGRDIEDFRAEATG